MHRKLSPLLPRLILLCVALLFASTLAFAQSQATTGDIEGRVLDPNGAAVPNATVTAKNQATGLEKTATTDGEGNYRIILLPPGHYTVRTSPRSRPVWCATRAAATSRSAGSAAL